jgi:hypothetical protein
MSKKNPKESILEFIQGKSCTSAEIVEGTKLQKIVVHNALKQLEKAKVITVEEKDDEKTFTVAEKLIDKTFDTPEQTEVEEPEGKELKRKSEEKKGRDNSKISFKKVWLKKSRYIHAVCCENFKNYTYAELKEMFPEKEIKFSYGFFVPVAEAREINKGRQRFFSLDSEIVKTRDGKRLSITNQMTLANLLLLREAFKRLKFVYK